MQINFVREVTAYKNALDAIIDPIRKYLPESTVTPKSGVKGDLNFCLFIRSQAPAPRVLMSHGVADKNYIKKDNADRFDWLFVPGPAYKDKHVKMGTDPSKVFVVGWPKLDPIFQGFITRSESDKLRVLYAPTHNAIKVVSSFPAFKKCLDKFPPEIEVISSPHPARKEDRMPTLQALVDTDVVISDSGSMIYEAWALGKPVIFPDWLVRDGVLNRFKGSFEAQIYEQNIGYHAKDFKHLLQLVDVALHKGVDEHVKEFMQEICPAQFNGKSGKTIAYALKDLAGQ